MTTQQAAKNKTEISRLVAQRREGRAKPAVQVRDPRKSIDPDRSYSREAIEHEIGLGGVWFRRAIKSGLEFRQAGKMKFVKGRDLIEFIHSGKGVASFQADSE